MGGQKREKRKKPTLKNTWRTVHLWIGQFDHCEPQKSSISPQQRTQYTWIGVIADEICVRCEVNQGEVPISDFRYTEHTGM